MSTAAAKPVAGKPAAAPPVDPAADGAEEAEAPKRKGSLVRYAVIGLVLVAALGGGYWFLSPYLPAWARLSSSTAKPAVKVEPPITHTVLVTNLVVNLGRPESKRYLKIGVELGLTSATHKKEVEEHKSQITDLIISTLAVTPVEALAEEKGRAELKRELVEKIHAELKLEAVRRVYFTEFVIQ
jgi:flagellar basal body-associated protein FliL